RILSRPSRLAALRRGDDHSSSSAIADGIERPTRRPSDGPSRLPIWSCSVRGFACRPSCHGRGALLPHLFTLTLRWPDLTVRTNTGRYVFCATVLRVAPTGCYPAHCPAEFGLSSRLRASRDGGRSSGSLRQFILPGRTHLTYPTHLACPARP